MQNEIKIYGLFDRILKLENLSDYVKIVYPNWQKENRPSPYDSDNEELYPDIKYVEKIIALQVSFYLLRRTAALCGSVGDTIWNMISQLKREYEEEMRRKYLDYNEGSDY